MSYLEKLTLFLRIKNRDRCIDGTDFQNDILNHMPRLHLFTFYICTCDVTVDSFHHLSTKYIQQTFANIGLCQVASVINTDQAVCSIFSLPFMFDRIEDIGNIFPNIVFSYVTYLLAQDDVPFQHEFFIRVARAFPLLKNFRIINHKPQSAYNRNTYLSDNTQSYAIAEYPHLTSLDLRHSDIDYVEQFLNEAKTYVPYLTELTIVYNNLRIVTNNFMREKNTVQLYEGETT